MTSGGFKIVTLLWILAMWRNTHWKKSLNYTNKLLFTWNINRQRSAVKSLVALWSQVFENVPFEIERALVVRWYILLNHTTSEGKQSVERERAKRIVWILNGGGMLYNSTYGQSHSSAQQYCWGCHLLRRYDHLMLAPCYYRQSDGHCQCQLSSRSVKVFIWLRVNLRRILQWPVQRGE